MSNIADLREDYRKAQLEIEEVESTPFQQFQHWFQMARQSELKEPNAMTLATCTPDGKPSARIVLLKGIDEKGFFFYTNYESRKGQELDKNPHAALVFAWLELEKQVRIEGIVERITAEQSTAYFQSRPKGSQIGAWASPQSQVIENRSLLEENVQALTAKYEAAETLPRPAHWGGYRLRPTVVEFWQGRSSRLHDRIRYLLQEDNSWKIERLAP